MVEEGERIREREAGAEEGEIIRKRRKGRTERWQHRETDRQTNIQKGEKGKR